MRVLVLSLLLPASALFADPLALRSQLQPGAPMSVEADAPEGDYVVKVTFGGDDVDSVTTVKGEARRLYALNVKVPKGGSLVQTYRVNVHQPEIKGGGKVSLKPREVGSPSWDGKLSLEFLGASARVRQVVVERDTDRPVYVRLLGDSTVTDQQNEPYCGWGQMLPVLFSSGVVVDNHAESGLTLASFQGGHRLEKVLSCLNEGDYVLIQFGHNDQKEKGEGVGAFTTYANRLRNYVKAIRAKDGNPILVTPVARRRFDAAGKVVESLGDFPEAVRRVAAELKVPLVDLNASSKQLYQALGVEKSKLALLHVPANTYPGQTAAIADDTHFSAYGAYEMARCVAEGLRTAEPTLAAHLRPELPRFDPAKPDEPASLGIPASAPRDFTKPDGK
jgi:lysophospholipase L1-like esterase